MTPHCPCSKQREERLQLLATALSAVPDFAYSSAHPHIARQLAHYAGTGLQDSPSTRQECAPRSPRHFFLPSLRTGREPDGARQRRGGGARADRRSRVRALVRVDTDDHHAALRVLDLRNARPPVDSTSSRPKGHVPIRSRPATRENAAGDRTRRESTRRSDMQRVESTRGIPGSTAPAGGHRSDPERPWHEVGCEGRSRATPGLRPGRRGGGAGTR